MQESNENSKGSEAPSPAPDFRRQMIDAQKSGDFGKLIHDAKEAAQMFHNCIQTMRAGSFPGEHVEQAAQIIAMLKNMRTQAEQQVETLRITEKEVRDAFKAVKKQASEVLAAVAPEPEIAKTEAVVPAPEPSAPPLEVIKPEAGPGWDPEPSDRGATNA